MPLHGSDINEKTTPFEARLKFVVKMNKEEFIGKKALLKQQEEKAQKLRVGLVMIDKGIPRPHLSIFAEGKVIGETTSGSYSPLMPKGYGVALGYVKREYKEDGKIVHIEIHGRKRAAEIIKPRKMLNKVKDKARQLKD
jgi:aminomethyltransferase